MVASLFLTSEGNKVAHTCLISSIFLFLFEFAVFCSGVLVNQAILLALSVLCFAKLWIFISLLHFYA